MDEEFVLIKNPKVHEKIMISLIKAFGYGFGGISTIPHFLFNGFKPTSKGFSIQSYVYKENGLNIYRSFMAKEKLNTKITGIETLSQILLYFLI